MDTWWSVRRCAHRTHTRKRLHTLDQCGHVGSSGQSCVFRLCHIIVKRQNVFACALIYPQNTNQILITLQSDDCVNPSTHVKCLTIKQTKEFSTWNIQRQQWKKTVEIAFKCRTFCWIWHNFRCNGLCLAYRIDAVVTGNIKTALICFY